VRIAHAQLQRDVVAHVRRRLRGMVSSARDAGLGLDATSLPPRPLYRARGACEYSIGTAIVGTPRARAGRLLQRGGGAEAVRATRRGMPSTSRSEAIRR